MKGCHCLVQHTQFISAQTFAVRIPKNFELVTESRLVERDWAIRDVNRRITGYPSVIR
jgi:virulence-associated protein VagC